jgi:tight adherence protein C
MNTMDLLARLAPFIAIVLLIYGVMVYFERRRAVKKRVRETDTVIAARTTVLRKEEGSPLKERLLGWLSSSGQWALKDEAEASKVQMLLIQGGFRHPLAATIYYGIRAAVGLILPVPILMIALIKGKLNATYLILAFMMAGLGYVLPQFVMERVVRNRQERIDRALPDVIDLFTICLEAGLAMQATINRVAEEIRAVCYDLYQELQVAAGEMRAGLPRDQALRNMVQRTGVQSVRSLATLIIQSDKLGTSIAQALRVHADSTRVQRTLRAEEKAGKLPVKILIPLILCYFPVIFIVVVGPGVIQIIRNLLPSLAHR